MAEQELEPVYVGGHVASYRLKKTSDSKSAKKQSAAKPASKAEEAKS